MDKVLNYVYTISLIVSIVWVIVAIGVVLWCFCFFRQNRKKEKKQKTVHLEISRNRNIGIWENVACFLGGVIAFFIFLFHFFFSVNKIKKEI